MKVGFTGTRYGMTEQQRQSLASLLLQVKPVEFHHGSCEGSDVQAARLVRALFPQCWITAHPGPDNCPWKRDSGVDNVVLPGLNHHARNRNIVTACDALVGTPKELSPRKWGGTWYTLNHGRDAGKCPIVIWPDGRRGVTPSYTFPIVERPMDHESRAVPEQTP